MTEIINTAYPHHTPLSIRMAAVIFPLLMEQAKRRELVTYGELARQAKVVHPANREVQNMIPISMGRKLDVVHAFCIKHALPDLASIAVNQATRDPGDSYVGKLNADELQREVFAFDWKSRAVEFDEHLAEEGKRAKKLTKRSELAARNVLHEYYKENKAHLPANVADYRNAILILLEEGQDAEDAFEMALRH